MVAQRPYIQVLGTDASGKSVFCEALTAARLDYVAFAHTETWVIDWLRRRKIPRPEDVTDEMIDWREEVFLRVNDVQKLARRYIRQEYGVVGVRGRADTLITHAALRGHERIDRRKQYFPTAIRPDLLVVLTASEETISARLDARGERKENANSLEFHLRCREMYLQIADLPSRTFPMVEFNTSLSANSPGEIVRKSLEALDDSFSL